MEQKKTQLENYLSNKLVSFLEPMVVEVLKVRPADPVDFCKKWLQKYEESRKNIDNSEDEEDDIVPDIAIAKKRQVSYSKKRSRIGISEEVFGLFNKQNFEQLKKIQKTQEARLLILSLIRNSILFKNIDSNSEEIIIDAMGTSQTKPNQTIITEGEAGNVLYIVEQGQYDCFKNIDGKQTYLRTYKFGESFGELALMYNAPRAATIRSKSNGKLFTLDRITFSQIVKKSASRRRSYFQNIVAKIDIFSDLNSYEKEQFYDSVKEQRFKENDYVVEQGGLGDKFYIVLEGKLVAEKYERCSLDPKVVFHYREGDYFGELALLQDVDRQANVKALTPVRLLSIERDTFVRSLGSLKNILSRSQKKYGKYGGDDLI